MAEEGRDENGKFAAGNLISTGNNGGRKNTTGLPRVKDVSKKEYDKLYVYYKRSTDKSYAKKDKIRGCINNAIRRSSANPRKGKASYYLGIDVKSYRDYLESLFTNEMNWDNRGTLWQIDHIKPLSLFNLLNEEECLEAFNYKNTQPLTREQNRIKHNKYTSDKQLNLNL